MIRTSIQSNSLKEIWGRNVDVADWRFDWEDMIPHEGLETVTFASKWREPIQSFRAGERCTREASECQHFAPMGCRQRGGA